MADNGRLSFLMMIYFMGSMVVLANVVSKPGWELIGLGGMFLLIIQALIWVCVIEGETA